MPVLAVVERLHPAVRCQREERSVAGVEPTIITKVFAVVMLVGLPVLSARSGLKDEHLEQIDTARISLYASATLTLAILTAGVFGMAAWQGIPAADLGWNVAEPGPALGWALGMTAAGLGVVWGLTALGRRLGLQESPLALALMPRTAAESTGFLLLAAAAAIGEEYIYRGYLYHVLAAWLGGPWPAVTITALSFGVSHGYQRAIGMARATALGVLLAIPVVVTGSLFAAIAAHFWINAALGLGGWKKLFPQEAE